MRELILQRLLTDDQGTFGAITVGGVLFHTAELPWRDNHPRVSCIPAGSYLCQWHSSPRFGSCYKLYGTEPRSEILIHPGNYAGDVAKGFKSNVEGCILLGLATYAWGGQRVVVQSREAVRRFSEALKRMPFKLTIKDMPK